MSNKKWNWTLPLLFSLILILGMWLGHRLTLTSGKGLFEKNKATALQQTLELIKNYYVDPLKVDSIEHLSIEQLLNQLDPHSVYLSPKVLSAANEELAGNFEGIGIEFLLQKDSVVVTYVIPNGPSDKAGLAPGDRILKAGNTSLVKKGIKSDEIKQLIRGPKKSTVSLQVLREGQLLNKTITRDEIPLPAVESSYLLDETTGYIRLSRFSENSYEDFMEALEQQLQKGMQRLVLDLRGNGGGFMNEAVDIADEFLDADKLIVYTEGVHYPKKEFRCKRPGLFEKGELVVLVDESSASASEVLAGALQDWCRANIIGKPTFGKGLVQEQFELSNKAAIRLTVARYYTPLGRSIQRSFKNGKQAYLQAAEQRILHAAAASESESPGAGEKKFFTRCGDTLYSERGIMPEQIVSSTSLIDNDSLPEGAAAAANEIALRFYVEHRQDIQKMNSPQDLLNTPSYTEVLWAGWLAFSSQNNNAILIQSHLLGLVARYRWGSNGYYQISNRNDPFVIAGKKAAKQ